jgi:hypothetical protein
MGRYCDRLASHPRFYEGHYLGKLLFVVYRMPAFAKLQFLAKSVERGKWLLKHFSCGYGVRAIIVKF